MTLGSDVDFYRASKFDRVLIGLIIFFAIVSILWINRERFRQSSQGKTALIYQRDNLLEKAGLEKDKIITMLNGKMQIEIKNRKLRVLNSDCPQHICMNMGWIKYSGQTIACVPNQVLIEIKSGGSPLLDAVSY